MNRKEDTNNSAKGPRRGGQSLEVTNKHHLQRLPLGFSLPNTRFHEWKRKIKNLFRGHQTTHEIECSLRKTQTDRREPPAISFLSSPWSGSRIHGGEKGKRERQVGFPFGRSGHGIWFFYQRLVDLGKVSIWLLYSLTFP